MEISPSDINNIKDEESMKINYAEPVQIFCSDCNKTVTTYLVEEYNIYTWLILFIILAIYGFFGLPLLIVFIPLCKNKNHSCSECLNLLYTIKFSTISIKREYVEISFEKCIIIVKKIYIMIFLGLLLIFAIIVNVDNFVLDTNDLISQHKAISITPNDSVSLKINKEYSSLNENNLKWEDLIKYCGSKVIIDNSARANEIFNRKFKGNVINWKGHFIISSYNPYDPSHVATYFIRMLPSESINGADIIISLDISTFEKYRELKFIRGDPIEFTGKLENLGNEWNPHHIHIIEIKKIEEFIQRNEKITLFQGVTVQIEGKRKGEETVTNTTEENKKEDINDSKTNTNN